MHLNRLAVLTRFAAALHSWCGTKKQNWTRLTLRMEIVRVLIKTSRCQLHLEKLWYYNIYYNMLIISWIQSSGLVCLFPNRWVEQLSKTRKCSLKDWVFMIVPMFFNLFQLDWGEEGSQVCDVAICVVSVVAIPWNSGNSRKQFELSRFIVQFLDFPN